MSRTKSVAVTTGLPCPDTPDNGFAQNPDRQKQNGHMLIVGGSADRAVSTGLPSPDTPANGFSQNPDRQQQNIHVLIVGAALTEKSS